MAPELTPADEATIAGVRAAPALDVDDLLVAIAAAALLEAGMSAPADPDVLADRLGLTVWMPPQHEKCDGRFCAGFLVVRKIFVCERWPDRLFSVAHEIGHWLLRRAGLDLQSPGRPDPEEERRADFIACEILAPGRTS